jgi:hypothetical protein
VRGKDAEHGKGRGVDEVEVDEIHKDHRVLNEYM